MKNKKLIWLLAPAVLIIWGLIGYQVFKAVKGQDEVWVPSTSEQVVKTIREDTTTYQLSLTYQDPFLKGGRSVVASAAPAKSTAPSKKAGPKVVKTVQKLPVKWPGIRYLGIIERNDHHLCLLNVDGTTVFMSPGETHGLLKLLRAFEDSVQIAHREGEKRTIQKQ